MEYFGLTRLDDVTDVTAEAWSSIDTALCRRDIRAPPLPGVGQLCIDGWHWLRQAGPPKKLQSHIGRAPDF
eukprot:5217320-Amphidinium_carterae.1